MQIKFITSMGGFIDACLYVKDYFLLIRSSGFDSQLGHAIYFLAACMLISLSKSIQVEISPLPSFLKIEALRVSGKWITATSISNRYGHARAACPIYNVSLSMFPSYRALNTLHVASNIICICARLLELKSEMEIGEMDSFPILYSSSPAHDPLPYPSVCFVQGQVLHVYLTT